MSIRFSTQLTFSRGTENILRQQKNLVDLQTQIGTGLRVQRPSDDPLALSTGISAQQGVSQTDQYIRNITNVRNQLDQVDTAMASASELMQTIKEGMIAAGSGVLSNSDKKIVGDDLRARLQELMGIANRRDTTGAFLFAGVKETTAPFNSVPSNPQPGDPVLVDPEAFYQYSGADENRSVQISTSRSVDLGTNAKQMFTDGGTPSQNYFASVQKVINALETGTSTDIQNALSAETGIQDKIFDQFQLARTRVGGRLRELDTVETLNRNTSSELQTISTKSVGVDYAKAISEISQGQTALEATQRTFSQVSKLSLFNFLQ
jgi:flagellar hook-associated protein 3 FlgL